VGTQNRTINAVSPGRHEVENPESKCKRNLCRWIPDPRSRGPGMTGNDTGGYFFFRSAS
jgi:hypothetical protein